MKDCFLGKNYLMKSRFHVTVQILNDIKELPKQEKEGDD